MTRSFRRIISIARDPDGCVCVCVFFFNHGRRLHDSSFKSSCGRRHRRRRFSARHENRFESGPRCLKRIGKATARYSFAYRELGTDVFLMRCLCPSYELEIERRSRENRHSRVLRLRLLLRISTCPK